MRGNDNKRNFILWKPIAAVLAVFAGISLIVVIFMQAKELHWWFVPCVAAVFLLLQLLLAYILKRREMAWIRDNVGDEQYFALFPKELKKEDRARRRKLRKDEARKRKAMERKENML
ncbi:MAG: hypothetical protein ACI3V2_09270 [Faecousia sp.]